MARLPRLALAHQLHHVVHRGNNRQPVFLDDDDYARMQALLVQASVQCGVAVHAYVLLPTQVHLLATPQTAQALALMMQAVGRSYARCFNNRHGRSGTLWEGRYRSTVVEADTHLLNCMVHIEQHPQSDGLVACAADWQWSSNAHHLGLRHDPLVKAHALFWALGNTPFAREAAYAARLEAGLSVEVSQAVSRAALHGWALGSADFVAKLQAQTGRRVSKSSAGRPRSPKIS